MLNNNLAAQTARSDDNLPEESINWVSGAPSHAMAPNKAEPLDTRAFDAINALVVDYRFHVERVEELDDRLRITVSERDGARERAAQWGIDRRTERHRADRLQREINDHVCRVRGHVCVERCKPNSHVATEGRHRLIEAERHAENLESERQGLIEGRRADHAEIVKLREDRDAARKTRDEIGNRLEIVARQRDDMRADRDRARAERDRRYTPAQMGDAQASEAELVASPLRKRIRDLEAQNAQLQEWLTSRENRQRHAENEVRTLRFKLDRYQSAFVTIANVVARAAVSQAVDPENPGYDTGPSRATLRDVVRQIRHQVRETNGRLHRGVSDSSPVEIGCGCIPTEEGSPASPTE